MNKILRPALPVLALLLLLSHPSLSFDGAKNGLLLWFNVILPTLLPFMLCSSLLTAWDGIPLLVKPLRPLLSLFRLSDEGGYCLLSGLLCGYPMGAKTTADFVKEERISRREGRLLLAVSGCPSPMFLAGYLQSRLPEEIPFFHLLLSLYLPLLFIGAAVNKSSSGDITVRPISGAAAKEFSSAPPSFEDLLMNSLEIMVKIGGFMMLYSILAAFIASVPDTILPVFFKSLLLGGVEMTTGIEFTAGRMTGLPAAVLMLGSAAFGGLSCLSQVHTVLSCGREKNAGLSIRHYVRWKLIHASLACAILILLSSLQQQLHLSPGPR